MIFALPALPALPAALAWVDVNTVWAFLTFVKNHPRCQYFAVSFFVGGGALRYIVWTALPYLKNQKKIQDRRHEVAAMKDYIEELCVSENISDVMDLDVHELKNDIKGGRLMAESVVKMVMKRALEVDKSVNAITQPIMEALEMARQLDTHPDREGVLFGLPVSIKECLDIAGYDTTAGMAFYLNEVATDDSIVVKVLKEHGAIPFVRTNIPQTAFGYCSSNYIYGETSNPHDHSRTPGGSSSGEGALIGGGGSFMGVGTDMGGNIRIPAAFCGCYCLKMTSNRVSNKGVMQTSCHVSEIQPCVCPIARDFKCLKLLCSALMSETMYEMDPMLPYQPFKKAKVHNPEPMRIGYFIYDGNARCQPSVIRAMSIAKFALETMGHSVFPVDLYDMSPPGFDAGEMYGRIVMADRFITLKQILSTERYERDVRLLFFLTSLPRWLLRILSFIMSFIDRTAYLKLTSAIGFGSAEEYLLHIEKFKKWRAQFTVSWQDLELDAMICPVFPSVAPKKEYMPLVYVAGSYCALFNSLDFPSGVLPVTRVTKQDIRDCYNLDQYDTPLAVDRLLLESARGSEGLPVAVQCVALPYREETCLRVMREAEEGLRKSHHHHHYHTTPTQHHRQSFYKKKASAKRDLKSIVRTL